MDNENKDVELPDIGTAKSITMPEKSKQRYELTYEGFKKWQNKNKVDGLFSEDVILTYFQELAVKSAPTTLWANYSMLRAMIMLHHNIDMHQYYSIIGFIKNQSRGYKPRQTKVFTNEDIAKFLSEAPDENFLATKVAAIFGILGSCKTFELWNISIQDVELHGDLYLVKIRRPNKNVTRSFTVSNDYFPIVQRYINLRPKNTKIDKFFLGYHNQKCIQQPMGKNKLGKMAEEIASYLKLSEASKYTGHSFKRTSSNVSRNSISNILVLRKKTAAYIENLTNEYIKDNGQSTPKTVPQVAFFLDQQSAASTDLSEECNKESNNTESNQDPLDVDLDINDMDSNDHTNHASEISCSDDAYSEDTVDFEDDHEQMNVNHEASEKPSETLNFTQQDIEKIPNLKLNLSGVTSISFNNCSNINIYINK